MPERTQAAVETRDVSPRVIWLLGLGFAVFVAVGSSGLLLFFQPGEQWTFHRLLKPAPVLQISPAADYADFIAAKRAELTGRGWQDREAGLVEIPVEAAMRLVARGYRARVESPPGTCTGAACPDATPTARTIP